MATFYYDNNRYTIDFLSSMGKNNADYELIGKGLEKRISEQYKKQYKKHGIERKALAEYKKDKTLQFKEYCQKNNYPYLNRYLKG